MKPMANQSKHTLPTQNLSDIENIEDSDDGEYSVINNPALIQNQAKRISGERPNPQIVKH